MKTIELTRGWWAYVDDEDYERVSRHKWFAEEHYRKDGTLKNVYARRNVWTEGKQHPQKLHRFILGVFDPKIQVDHEDHHGLNCCRNNIRVATQTQNQANARLRRDNKSGFKGVIWLGRISRWVAYISVNKKRIHIGVFDTKEAAAIAYNLVAVSRFGKFAHLNKVPTP